MATSAEQLILRGLHLVLRTTFAPNDQAASAAHFLKLQNEIGPWFKDYAEEIAKPAVDFTLTPREESDGGGGWWPVELNDPIRREAEALGNSFRASAAAIEYTWGIDRNEGWVREYLGGELAATYGPMPRDVLDPFVAERCATIEAAIRRLVQNMRCG